MIFIIGFIQQTYPYTLINPTSCAGIDELFQWLESFLHADDFVLSEPLTLERLEKALAENTPVQIYMNANLALIFGEYTVMRKNLDDVIQFD